MILLLFLFQTYFLIFFFLICSQCSSLNNVVNLFSVLQLELFKAVFFRNIGNCVKFDLLSSTTRLQLLALCDNYVKLTNTNTMYCIILRKKYKVQASINEYRIVYKILN